MTIEKLNMDSERKVITNLITSDRFCKEIIPICKSSYFDTSYAKEVSKWVIEYYSQYKKAPGKDIKAVYESKKEINIETETKDSIYVFLKNLSKHYEDSIANNIDFEIIEAVKYLKLRSLEIHNETIEDCLQNKDVEKGEQAIANFKRVEKGLGQGVDLLRDTDKVIDALITENNEIIKFPGAIGQIIPPVSRGDFISFFGPAKRGKSFWLWYCAEIAMYQGCKVLYIPLEMTEGEIIRRSWPSITGKPLYKKTIYSAHFDYDEESKLYTIVQDKEEKDGFDIESVHNIQNKLKRIYRKGRIKIVPMIGATVEMIETTCDNLYYYENFSPDVIIIDYGDYMEAGKRHIDNRDRINIIWKGLRDLALKTKRAIITASHTEKKTFNSDIKTSQVSEDIRKINHVTAAIALNASEKEKENNIIRLKLMEVRQGRHTSEQAIVLQCLDLGRPCIDSKLKSEVSGYKSLEEKDDYNRK